MSCNANFYVEHIVFPFAKKMCTIQNIIAEPSLFLSPLKMFTLHKSANDSNLHVVSSSADNLPFTQKKPTGFF